MAEHLCPYPLSVHSSNSFSMRQYIFLEYLLHMRHVLRKQEKYDGFLYSQNLGNDVIIGKAALENLRDWFYCNTFTCRIVDCDIGPGSSVITS